MSDEPTYVITKLTPPPNLHPGMRAQRFYYGGRVPFLNVIIWETDVKRAHRFHGLASLKTVMGEKLNAIAGAQVGLVQQGQVFIIRPKPRPQTDPKPTDVKIAGQP